MQNLWLVFVLGAALTWGAYGPALHKGRAGFPDAPTASLRALVCVGMAYFLVAVIVPLGALWWQGKLSGFTTSGSVYSIAAGILGALGAVCIIWAFKNKGSPMIVMPLVFAGAPVVNSVITTLTHKGSAIHPLLYVGFVLALGGAFMVLRYMPS